MIAIGAPRVLDGWNRPSIRPATGSVKMTSVGMAGRNSVRRGVYHEDGGKKQGKKETPVEIQRAVGADDGQAVTARLIVQPGF